MPSNQQYGCPKDRRNHRKSRNIAFGRSTGHRFQAILTQPGPHPAAAQRRPRSRRPIPTTTAPCSTCCRPGSAIWLRRSWSTARPTLCPRAGRGVDLPRRPRGPPLLQTNQAGRLCRACRKAHDFDLAMSNPKISASGPSPDRAEIPAAILSVPSGCRSGP